eukprot:Hpha_TRINITY_DN15641_c0_g3::TRINITY_DN15641_c0_g3_i1::g.98162::m.98162
MALTDDEVRQAFNLFDADGSGEISKKELRFAFKSMGLTYVSDADIDDFFRTADKDHDGKLSVDEFTSLVRKNMRQSHSKEDIVHLFEEFSGGGGEITEQDLVNVTRRIFGEPEPEQKIQKVMKWVKYGYQTDFPEAEEMPNISLLEFEYAGTKYDPAAIEQRHKDRKKRREEEKKLESSTRRRKSPKSGDLGSSTRSNSGSRRGTPNSSGTRSAPERPGTPDERRSRGSRGSRGSGSRRSQPRADASGSKRESPERRSASGGSRENSRGSRAGSQGRREGSQGSRQSPSREHSRGSRGSRAAGGSHGTHGAPSSKKGSNSRRSHPTSGSSGKRAHPAAGTPEHRAASHGTAAGSSGKRSAPKDGENSSFQRHER